MKNLKEPTDKCVAIQPKNLNLMIIPARVIDIYGNRIGSGKGYYDKYL